jgi:hypothetical protein
VNHIIIHVDSYSSEGFSRILSVLRQAPDNVKNDDWIEALSSIHESVQVSIGTEEYHTIQGFCKTLQKPRKLEARRHKLEAIHLAPRVICDPTPLNIKLSASFGPQDESAWTEVSFFDDDSLNTFSISEKSDNPIKSIEYWLNLEDAYPSSGGLISQGKDVIRRSLEKLGLSKEPTSTFESKVEFSDKQLNSTESAVLERLISGKLKVLSNTLVGSPQVVDSLLKTGAIALIPGFNHIGVNPDFLLFGHPDIVRDVSRTYCLEATIFNTKTESAAVVSAPGTWKSELLKYADSKSLKISLIHSISSSRKILRDEQPFSKDDFVYTWSQGAI